jgi:hypothetical protein
MLGELATVLFGNTCVNSLCGADESHQYGNGSKIDVSAMPSPPTLDHPSLTFGNGHHELSAAIPSLRF